MIKKIFFFIFLQIHIFAGAIESDILVYNENVQVSASVDTYQKIVSGAPVKGTIMVTHSEKKAVDINSFMLGNKPLQVVLMQTVPADTELTLSIYQFKLEPLAAGTQVVPSIKVNVGGKLYESPPFEVYVDD